MPSVLIVEDHALFRSGLKQLIGIEPGLTVAGEAGDGLAGIRLAQSLRPDLILLDISMPELSGVEAIPVSGRLPRERASLSFPCTPQPGMYARP